MNVRSIGLNVMAQVGIGNLAAHVRYALLSTFDNKESVNMTLCAIGISWYW